MVEYRAREDDLVDDRRRDAELGAFGALQPAGEYRAVQVERSIDPRVDRRKHDGVPFVGDEADVADQGLIKDTCYRSEIVVTALGMPPQRNRVGHCCLAM